MWERGVRVALPVAIALSQPLIFREWHPNAPMARGLWKIPYPAEGAEVVPTVVLAPVVGFDKNCFRLGYGGGFFDRTLARFPVKPLVIGVGYVPQCIDSHDLPATSRHTHGLGRHRRNASVAAPFPCFRSLAHRRRQQSRPRLGMDLVIRPGGWP
jgi:5,10-methenyltetrahydrofolate synthetase